jgi:hypothetical protein
MAPGIDRFMVSLSNHEAVPHHVRTRPSWFDRLTMKAFPDESATKAVGIGRDGAGE